MFKAFLSKITGQSSQRTAEDAPKKTPGAPPEPPMRPQDEALFRAIEERRQTDPLVGAKLAGKEVVQRLIEAMKNDKGVHVESLLCVLGSLAGYACQASLRELAINQGAPETSLLMVVSTKDGKQFFFGDHLNKPLAESTYSIWSLSAGAAQHNGCKNLPDLSEIFSYVTSTVGNNEYGTPRIPEGHKPGDLPVNYLKGMWLPMLKTVRPFCKTPEEWPLVFGFAIQEVMDMGKSVITPELALLIVMESAIPMSKVDLASY